MSYVRGEIGFGDSFHIVAQLKPEYFSSYNSHGGNAITNQLLNQWFGLSWSAPEGKIYLSPSYTAFENAGVKCKFEYFDGVIHLFVMLNGNWYGVNENSSFVMNYDSVAENDPKNLAVGNPVYNIENVYGGINYAITGKLGTNLSWYVATASNARNGYNINSQDVLGTMRVEQSPVTITTMTSDKFDFYFIPTTEQSYLPGGEFLSQVHNLTAIQFFGKWLGNTTQLNKLTSGTTATLQTEIIYTEYSHALQAHVYNYCIDSETCGNCMGISEDGNACVVDSLTTQHHEEGTDTPLTSDPNRTMQGHTGHYDAPVGMLIGIILAVIALIFTIVWEVKYVK